MADFGFKIDNESKQIKAINRTVRINSDSFDKITVLSEKYNISFNKVVNQCLKYALDNLIEDEEDNEK